MWGVDCRWGSVITLLQNNEYERPAYGLTLCVRILFRELDRGGDRLLGFLCEFVVHCSKVVVILVWETICEMDLE
jgi:hypothetical protein